MNTKTKVILCTGALLGAFAAGRWACPEKVRVDTHTVEVEKKSEQVKTDTDRDRHVDTTVTVITLPDGTKEQTTHTVQDTHTQQERKLAETDSTTKDSDTLKETIYASSRVTISLLGGVSTDNFSKPVYGVSLTKPILGPITVGIFGLSDRTFGCSVGLTF